MTDNEATSVSQTSFGDLCFKALFAGATIGALQGLAGYLPRADSFVIAVEAAVVGALVATLLAVSLYKLARRSGNIASVFRATVWISGICGVSSAIIARWLTHGEGAIVSMLVTPPVAFITAIVASKFHRSPIALQ